MEISEKFFLTAEADAKMFERSLDVVSPIPNINSITGDGTRMFGQLFTYESSSNTPGSDIVSSGTSSGRQNFSFFDDIGYVGKGAVGEAPKKVATKTEEKSEDFLEKKPKQLIVRLCKLLGLKQDHIDMAWNIFILALKKCHSCSWKSIKYLSAACVFIMCRTEGTRHMLIELSDVFQMDVFQLGRTYNNILKGLCITFTTLDPCFYVSHFAGQLGFGEKRFKICMTAVRILSRISKDLIYEQARTIGLCASAVLIAATLHKFERTVDDVIQEVHKATFSREAQVALEKRSQWIPEEFKRPCFSFTTEQDSSKRFEVAYKWDKIRMSVLERNCGINKVVCLLQSEIQNRLKYKRNSERCPSPHFTELDPAIVAWSSSVGTRTRDETSEKGPALFNPFKFEQNGSPEATSSQENEIVLAQGQDLNLPIRPLNGTTDAKGTIEKKVDEIDDLFSAWNMLEPRMHPNGKLHSVERNIMSIWRREPVLVKGTTEKKDNEIDDLFPAWNMFEPRMHPNGKLHSVERNIMSIWRREPVLVKGTTEKKDNEIDDLFPAWNMFEPRMHPNGKLHSVARNIMSIWRREPKDPKSHLGAKGAEEIFESLRRVSTMVDFEVLKNPEMSNSEFEIPKVDPTRSRKNVNDENIKLHEAFDWMLKSKREQPDWRNQRPCEDLSESTSLSSEHDRSVESEEPGIIEELETILSNFRQD